MCIGNVVPVGNVIQEKTSNLDKISTVTNLEVWEGLQMFLWRLFWKFSEYEKEMMCSLVEHWDKLKNPFARICLPSDGAQVSSKLRAEVKRMTFLERRDLYLAMSYMRIYMHVNKSVLLQVTAASGCN